MGVFQYLRWPVSLAGILATPCFRAKFREIIFFCPKTTEPRPSLAGAPHVSMLFCCASFGLAAELGETVRLYGVLPFFQPTRSNETICRYIQPLCRASFRPLLPSSASGLIFLSGDFNPLP
jgi:hypothetical protein